MSAPLLDAAVALEQAAAALRQASLDQERLVLQASQVRREPDAPELIGAAEAMRLLGVRSRTTLDQLTRGKSFRTKVGAQVRFNRPALLRWALARRPAPMAHDELRDAS